MKNDRTPRRCRFCSEWTRTSQDSGLCGSYYNMRPDGRPMETGQDMYCNGFKERP